MMTPVLSDRTDSGAADAVDREPFDRDVVRPFQVDPVVGSGVARGDRGAGLGREDDAVRGGAVGPEVETGVVAGPHNDGVARPEPDRPRAGG